MLEKKFDIVICGAGMIGMTFALLLTKKNLNVCLIDKNKESDLKGKHDTRTTAVSQGSSRILNEVGIWSMLKKNAQQINKIIVSEGESADLRFDHKNLTEGPLGFIIENKDFKKILIEKVKKESRISFFENEEITEIDNTDAESNVLRTNNLKIKYKILIAADGRFSKIRFLADIKYYFHDYGQNAFVFNISHEEPHLGVALERFFPSGPLAVLPVKDSSINQSSVVWTVDSKISETQEFKENFQDEFKKKYSNFFGKLKKISNIQKYPLNVFSCYDYFNKNVILIGDACQAVHPIAGQGFNLGLRDALYLSKLISDYSENGLQISSKHLLESYKSQRIIDKRLLVFATHNLNMLFSRPGRINSLIRKTGLRLFSKSTFLKNQSMLFAMGLRNLEV